MLPPKSIVKVLILPVGGFLAFNSAGHNILPALHKYAISPMNVIEMDIPWTNAAGYFGIAIAAGEYIKRGLQGNFFLLSNLIHNKSSNFNRR